MRAVSMIETVRARLTLWYVSALALMLIVVGGLIYLLLARALYTRVDESLQSLMEVAMTSLANDLAEGQDAADAARSTAAELASRQQMLAIYDGAGRLLASETRDKIAFALPALDSIPRDELLFMTVGEVKDDDDRHRLALRRVTIRPSGTEYVLVVGHALEPTDEELESLRQILGYVVPGALIVAGFGGWFLAKRSLSPVTTMAERARRIGAENVSARLPVANPRDELGQLAEAFNELLARLDTSLTQQRQFMADASHELRTPVATSRAAASIALQQPNRDEADYRDTLAIVEQQTARLSRIVEDMFTLARVDAGSHPVQRMPMYLDEVLEEIVRGARVLASSRRVSIDIAHTTPSAAFTGDEDLIRRLIVNLLDNAIRHAPADSSVTLDLVLEPRGYRISIHDDGPGVPPDIQKRIFERFFRRATPGAAADGGAGLGLAVSQWIAQVHGGSISLTRASEPGTTFEIHLPAPGA